MGYAAISQNHVLLEVSTHLVGKHLHGRHLISTVLATPNAEPEVWWRNDVYYRAEKASVGGEKVGVPARQRIRAHPSNRYPIKICR